MERIAAKFDLKKPRKENGEEMLSYKKRTKVTLFIKKKKFFSRHKSIRAAQRNKYNKCNEFILVVFT